MTTQRLSLRWIRSARAPYDARGRLVLLLIGCHIAEKDWHGHLNLKALAEEAGCSVVTIKRTLQRLTRDRILFKDPARSEPGHWDYIIDYTILRNSPRPRKEEKKWGGRRHRRFQIVSFPERAESAQ